MSIGRWYSDQEVNLGPIFTWLYWLVELSIIGFMTVALVKPTANKPFCEHCYNWYGKERHVGGFGLSRNIEAMQVIHQKNFAKLGGMLEENADIPSSEVYLQSCKTCDLSDTWFVLRGITYGRYRNLKYNDLIQQYISNSEKLKIMEALRYTFS